MKKIIQRATLGVVLAGSLVGLLGVRMPDPRSLR